MQKATYTQYAAAGTPAIPGVRMNVRSHVRVPDSEAGCETEPDRQPYYAQSVVKRTSSRGLTIPANVGAIFLCLVFVFFGVMVVLRANQRATLSKRITAMENSISQTMRDNVDLTVQVMEARDSSRICYAAAQNLGMVAATGVDAVLVVAPDTRPFEHESVWAVNSPFSVQNGIISGSR